MTDILTQNTCIVTFPCKCEERHKTIRTALGHDTPLETLKRAVEKETPLERDFGEFNANLNDEQNEKEDEEEFSEDEKYGMLKNRNIVIKANFFLQR